MLILSSSRSFQVDFTVPERLLLTLCTIYRKAKDSALNFVIQLDQTSRVILLQWLTNSSLTNIVPQTESEFLFDTGGTVFIKEYGRTLVFVSHLGSIDLLLFLALHHSFAGAILLRHVARGVTTVIGEWVQ